MSSPTDFDFFHGRWTVSHRRLLRRLAGCTEWQIFGGTSQVWPLLGGAGNVDDNWIDLPGAPYRAATIRSWDPAARTWQIWWLDARYPQALGTPMIGRFEGGVGTFYDETDFEGRPIQVRFLWSGVDSPSPRWEQAFSVDGGASWETNWEMDFTRAA